MPVSGSFTGFGEPLQPGPTFSGISTGPDFGRDVSTYPDGLDPSFGQLTGPAVVGQAVLRRLRTPRGSLPFYPDYGFDLRRFLNEGITDAALSQIRAGAQREAEKDERVASADVTVRYLAATEELRVEVQLQTAAGPFKLVLQVTQLDVTQLPS